MNIQEAAKKLLAGELVVFPTETVYGLGAVANNDLAVEKIFTVKGRPAINPLIVHIAKIAQLKALVTEIPPAAEKLMSAFWPGPLTICFKKSPLVSDLVTAGLATVCIRNPSHPIAHELLQLVEEPIAAPSANLSGRPSTTTFSDAKQQLEQQGVYFLDGGDTPIGLESTVVDCTSTPIKLLRPGTISQQALEEVLGMTISDESDSKKISSPGQLLSHYAPKGKLTIICGEPEKRRQWMAAHLLADENQTAFGLIGNNTADLPGRIFSMCDTEQDLETYAARLYRFLNWCDQEQVSTIILELPGGEHPVLTALINRLQKASQGNIVRM